MRGPYRGWIKLWRMLEERSDLASDNDAWRVWTSILLRAEHDPSGREVRWGEKSALRYNLGPGQLVITETEFAASCNIDRFKLRRILAKLAERERISVNPSPTGTLITVLNWKMYQSNPKKRAVNRYME